MIPRSLGIAIEHNDMVKKEGGEHAVCHSSNVSLQLSMSRKHAHLHVNNNTHPHVPPLCKHAHHHVNNHIFPHLTSLPPLRCVCWLDSRGSAFWFHHWVVLHNVDRVFFQHSCGDCNVCASCMMTIHRKLATELLYASVFIDGNAVVGKRIFL